MKKNDGVRLRHIFDAIVHIETFTHGVNEEEFLKDEKTVSAVICQLEIIGESMNGISDEFRAVHMDIPYGQIIGMRNILVHEYFGVQRKRVWGTVKKDLPILKQIIGTLLERGSDV